MGNNNFLENLESNYTIRVMEDVNKYKNKYGFDKYTHSTWNNSSDAFRHAYMQAQLSLWGGNYFANFLGNRHEIQGNARGQSSNEDNMDRWNNQVGREIAKEIIKEYGYTAKFPSNKINDIIAEKIMQKMRAGKLITSPNDKRRYIDGNPTGFAADIEHIFTRDEIEKMSIEEWQQNEEAIMKQLKEQGIPTQQELTNTKLKNYQNEDGRWVTINGNHVFIED